MAVYTDITRNDLEAFLLNYDLGKLIEFEGIQEGVENSNFKISTERGFYILTIFEKRVSSKDLPFFTELMNHLSMKGYKCPKPIENKSGVCINNIKNKPCVIVTFIKGSWTKKIFNHHCEQLGSYLARLHLATSDFKISRNNTMGVKTWDALFRNFKNNNKEKYGDIYNLIEKEMNFLLESWPLNLPSGVIHADLFQDNVFFDNDQLSGIIDFYFACNDFYAYELAVTLNAWCFEKDGSFNITKARLILNSYQKERPLIDKEKEYLPTLSRGAALRFLLTRLNDLIFHPKDAFVKPKDPEEYLKILRFHQGIKSSSEYGMDNR